MNAPERIWMFAKDLPRNLITCGDTEYVRADVAVQVKPLAWVERTEGLWRADDPTGGCYEVIELSESRAACHHVVRGYGVNIGSTHQSVDDAKEASQDHFTLRIVAALYSPPTANTMGG